MVCPDLERRYAPELSILLLEIIDNRQELFIVNRVVVLGRVVFPREEGYRPEGPIVVILRERSSDRVP